MVRRSLAGLPLLLGAVAAIRRLELTASSGEVAGEYAFKGGENEATCKACIAVMEHIQRRMDMPFTPEFYGRKRTGKMGLDAMNLNTLDKVQTILDAKQCQPAMKSYDLAYIKGENTFFYRDPKYGDSPGYPIHMELNDWAKNELALFCENLIEEKEEELTTLLLAYEKKEPDAKPISDSMCKEELDLCHPPPPPPPPKPLTKEQKKEKAEAAFKGLDANSDGFIDKREIQSATKNSQRKGELREGAKVKDEVDKFFSSCDNNGDLRCSLKEYKQLWGFKLKKKKSAEGDDDGDDGPSLLASLASTLKQVPAIAERLVQSTREYAKAAPYAALSGVGAMSAAVYVGGMVARVW